MKLPRTAAAAIGIAVLAASALATAVPASAATPDVTYVHLADLVATPTPGANTFGYTGTAPTDQLSGLTFDANQILTKGFTAGALAVDFGTFLGDTTVGTNAIAANDKTAIGYYTSPGVYSVIVAVGTGRTTQWDPSVGLWSAAGGFGTLPAGNYTLDALDAEAATAYPALSIAYLDMWGVAVTIVFTDLDIDGVQYIFTPTPVSTAATTIAAAAYGTTGFTVTTSGFRPNETGIDVGIGSAGGGNSVGTVTANAQGVASFTYVEPSPVAGAYRMTFTGSVPNRQIFDFTVTAAALPAMGVETTLPIIAGSALLLGGAALAVVASKRRKRA